MKKILFVVMAIFFSCNSNRTACDNLLEGSFDLYENNLLIGQLFRKDNIQIEKYADKSSYTIVGFERINPCQFHLKHRKDILRVRDTITWLVEYTAIGKDTFEVKATAAFIDSLDYVYTGQMVKTSNELPIEMSEMIKITNRE